MPGVSLPAADPDIADAFRIFDTYLDGPADHPVGVAVSGGGDSVALLYALGLWGKRPLEVFCVDHGINPESGRWTASVAAHAEAAGARFTALKWTGGKPKTGLSAAARVARHALLGDAARQKGVRILCLAHTEDDIFEAVTMADEGSNVGTPQMWAPSPAWPEGRGVFLFRPFLGKRRADLRAFLTGSGIDWIDDPANSDRNSHRARVRQDARRGEAADRLSMHLQPVFLAHDLPGLLRDADTLGALGMLVFDAHAFDALPEPLAVKRLAAAIVSAGGGNKLPRRDSLARLIRDLPAGAAHTLCGARIQRAGDRIDIVREAGEFDRAATAPLHLAPGGERVWDGRFSISADRPCAARPVTQVRAHLSDTDRASLQTLPAPLRPVLPAIVKNGGEIQAVANPSLTQSSYKDFSCVGWVMYRFLAASGAYDCESSLARAEVWGQ